MSAELKPCPFCGSAAAAYDYDDHDGDTVYCVGCTNRDCISPYEPCIESRGSQDAANARWNTRAPVVIDREMVYRAIHAFDPKESPVTAMFKVLQAALNPQEKPE